MSVACLPVCAVFHSVGCMEHSDSESDFELHAVDLGLATCLTKLLRHLWRKKTMEAVAMTLTVQTLMMLMLCLLLMLR